MRTEEQIYDLLLRTAQEDDRIRAVYMNGSRTNPNVPKDIFQDYDVVYVVKDNRDFIEDKEWIRRFGEIWFMQYPDESAYDPGDKENSYGWLMQFKDGVRIDLTVQPVHYAVKQILKDKLCRILLDKDGCLPEMPEATDEDYYVKKPDEQHFLSTCNEFWWCLDNVAKGLWRKELPYANDMLNFVIRKELERMLSWKAGIRADFSISVGKSAKYLYRWIDEEEYRTYLETYSCGSVEDCWESVFKMTKLMARTARYVAEHLGFTYNADEEEGCMAFLKVVRELPNDAQEVVPGRPGETK